MIRLSTSTSSALGDDRRSAIRALLDDAFDGDFGDDDWEHSLGGVHVLIEDGDVVVAHASVVPRSLSIGSHLVHVGYVEAVAVSPALQRSGHGTAAMRSIGDEIQRSFALGVLSTGEWHFYERLGWERWQGPTWVRHPDGTIERTEDEDDGVMILRTEATHLLDLASPITCDARPGDAW